ncbi:MAG: hypothetical protein JNL50_01880 [Phycisphaerae bacterium]|nr:hypothetical protein [Phycisphaerae bacterium]
MRTAFCVVVLAGPTSAAFAGFTGLFVSRQLEAGSLIHDVQTFQDFEEKQNFVPGLWADTAMTSLTRNGATANARSSQSSRVGVDRFEGSTSASMFARAEHDQFARAGGSSEYLIHFNVHNTVTISYLYKSFINIESGDGLSAHSQMLVLRLDDNFVVLQEQSTGGNITRFGEITLQPARYAFLMESAIQLNSPAGESHDGFANTNFDFRLVPAPGCGAAVALGALAGLCRGPRRKR